MWAVAQAATHHLCWSLSDRGVLRAGCASLVVAPAVIDTPSNRAAMGEARARARDRGVCVLPLRAPPRDCACRRASGAGRRPRRLRLASWSGAMVCGCVCVCVAAVGGGRAGGDDVAVGVGRPSSGQLMKPVTVKGVTTWEALPLGPVVRGD